MSHTVEKLRAATRGTEYEGRLFLVGGYPRDRLLGLPVSPSLNTDGCDVDSLWQAAQEVTGWIVDLDVAGRRHACTVNDVAGLAAGYGRLVADGVKAAAVMDGRTQDLSCDGFSTLLPESPGSSELNQIRLKRCQNGVIGEIQHRFKPDLRREDDGRLQQES